VPLGVTTLTSPGVTPIGTLVMISEAETVRKAAVVPLNVTVVAPLRSVPMIFTTSPTLPARGVLCERRFYALMVCPNHR